MKSIICTRPGTLETTDVPEPRLSAGNVLVKMSRLGICGTDLHAFGGRQPFFTYPRILGHELAAKIIDTDDNAAALAPGDQVAIIPYLECGSCVACRAGRTNCCVDLKVLGVHQDGGMCEQLVIPQTHVIKNNGIPLDHLALVECFAIGAHAVRRGGIRQGEHVLVAGAGPIGLGIMQFARVQGGRVTALDISTERLDFARHHLGIEQVVNPAEEDAKARIADLTDGDFPTAIFDATGNKTSMQNNFHLLAHGGRYVLVGLVIDDICFPDPEFHKRETTLMSSRNAVRDDFLWVMQCMAENRLAVDPMITHRCSFSHLLDEFAHWTHPESHVVKAVVEF